MEEIRCFDLLKAFGYMERGVKSGFSSPGKDLFFFHVRNMFWATMEKVEGDGYSLIRILNSFSNSLFMHNDTFLWPFLFDIERNSIAWHL